MPCPFMSNEPEAASVLCKPIGAHLWPSMSSRPTISTSVNTTWRTGGGAGGGGLPGRYWACTLHTCLVIVECHECEAWRRLVSLGRGHLRERLLCNSENAGILVTLLKKHVLIPTSFLFTTVLLVYCTSRNSWCVTDKQTSHFAKRALVLTFNVTKGRKGVRKISKS